MSKAIHDFLNKIGIYQYEITEQGYINITGDVIYTAECPIPEGFKFGHVSGRFTTRWCYFDSLFAFPLSVGGIVSIWLSTIEATVENFDVLYRYDFDNIQIGSGLKAKYDKYYKARKRIETINEILK